MQQFLATDQNKDLHLNSPMLLRWHNQLALLSYRIFEPYGELTNVVSTRLGGVSDTPYNALNLSLSSADDPQAILENRRRLCLATGIEAETLTVGQLEQRTNIAIINEGLRGRGALDRAKALKDTDGLATNLRNTPLAILVADCTVVSYFDPKHQAIALAHAGWRGTTGMIARSMVETMVSAFGSNPSDLLVGISPNIAADHFQVRDDVLQAFRESYGAQADTFFEKQNDGSYHLDLNAALVTQLTDAGIQQSNIEVCGICTACRTDIFYSHRAEQGKTGRFAGLIVLRS